MNHLFISILVTALCFLPPAAVKGNVACTSNAYINSNSTAVSFEYNFIANMDPHVVPVIVAIVKNKEEFYWSETGDNHYFSDLTDPVPFVGPPEAIRFSVLDTACPIQEFAIFDLDGDGNPELLLETIQGDTIVLDVVGNTTFGYVFPYRGMNCMKTDRTFGSSGRSTEYCVQTVRFINGAVIYKNLYQVDGVYKVYQIDGQDAGDLKRLLFLIVQDLKPDLQFYPYTSDDLLSYLEGY